MQSSPAKQGWKPSLTFYPCFSALTLLLSLDGLRSAELAAAGRGWYLHGCIAFPWVCAAIWGVGFWLQGRNGKLDREMAGGAMFVLAIIVSAAYQAMDELTRQMHGVVSGLHPASQSRDVGHPSGRGAVKGKRQTTAKTETDPPLREG